MRTQSYQAFWQRIHQTAQNKAFPLRVMFELTYRCNFKCKHCYVPYSYRKKGELITEEVFFILDQLKDIGCLYLGFTGGEPFIRKDIIEILWYAKKKGFQVILYTNASLINEKIADELQRLKPNKVDITIPAISKEAFEQITEASGSHREVFGAIDLLHRKGINVGFKTCVLKENESEIKNIQGFSAALGALHRLDNMLSPCLDGSRDPYKYRGILKEYSSGIRSQGIINGDLDDCNKKTIDYRLSTIDLFTCGVGKSQATITPQGELKMCLMIDYPKYKILNKGVVSRKTGLREAWVRLKKLVASIQPDENYQCDSCNLYDHCKWCPARAWLKNKSFTACDPESRCLEVEY